MYTVALRTTEIAGKYIENINPAFIWKGQRLYFNFWLDTVYCSVICDITVHFVKVKNDNYDVTNENVTSYNAVIDHVTTYYSPKLEPYIRDFKLSITMHNRTTKW